MYSYNLIDQEWIPILDFEQNHRQISLKEALCNAHQIQEIYGDTSLETAALYRLLLALYLRIFPEQEEKKDWKAQLAAGKFDTAKIKAYFQKWYHRFDLLDAQRPFYQTPNPLKSEKGEDFINPIEKLFTEKASNNNPVFYSHTYEKAEQLIPLDKVARGLVAFQNFAIGGGVAKPFNFANANMVGTMLFWIRGNHLLEALLRNAPPIEGCRSIETSKMHLDAPTWERDLPKWEKRPTLGYLDYLTWQPRALKLVTIETNNGVFAKAVIMHQGDKLDVPVIDPLLAYKKGKEGFYSMGFNPDKALWREAEVFLNTVVDKQNKEKSLGKAPRTFIDLQDKHQDKKWQIDVLGMANDQGTVVYLKQERMPVYSAFLNEDNDHFFYLQKLLEDANKQKDNLRWAIKTTCEWILATPKEGENVPKADAGSVGKLLEHFGLLPRYWAALEAPFYQKMEELAQLKDSNEIDHLLDNWAKEIYQIAQDIFREATNAFNASGRSLRAIIAGEKNLKPVDRLMPKKAENPKKSKKNSPLNLQDTLFS